MHTLTDDQLRVLMFAAAHWEDYLRGDDPVPDEADEIREVLRELGD